MSSRSEYQRARLTANVRCARTVVTPLARFVNRTKPFAYRLSAYPACAAASYRPSTLTCADASRPVSMVCRIARARNERWLQLVAPAVANASGAATADWRSALVVSVAIDQLPARGVHWPEPASKSSVNAG